MHRASTCALALGLGLLAGAPASAAAKAEKSEKAEKGEKTEKAAVAEIPLPAPVPELAERLIEKRDGPYIVKVLLRPGNLKLRRTADVTVEMLKVLEIPDPVSGDRMALSNASSYVTVKSPAPLPEPVEPPAKGKKAVEPVAPVAPAPIRYQLYPQGNPGSFGFHFTPEHDGIYDVTFTGIDPKPGDGEEPKSFDVTFHIGAGLAAPQTEQSQGAAAARKGSRRPVGSDGVVEKRDKLQVVMEEIGQRYLDLGSLLQKWPAKGAHADAAAEARAIGALFATAQGLAPAGTSAASPEFDKLVAATPEAFEELAKLASVEGKEKERGPHLAAANAFYEKLETQSCSACHAKFRWGLTTDLSTWPSYEMKPWKK